MIAYKCRRNYTAAEYVRQQIKRVVKDKETAEILCPRSYPIGTKRICIDTGYFETYNRENVKLVDISKKPIQRLVADGIIVDDQLYAFDSIIFATGFDAMTGSILNVDIKGRGGLALKEKWNAGPKTYLGLMSASFPNLFMITGPGSPSVQSHLSMSIEQHVDLVIETLLSMRRKGLSVVEPELEAENKWVDHVGRWLTRRYSPKPIPGIWAPIFPENRDYSCLILALAYREICEEIVANNYRGLSLTSKQVIAAE